ncbi:hypothetical protein [Secundilactobacillus muriivasis]
MNKTGKWLITGIIATLAGLGGTSLTASASTWHKGTPSVLKGKYYRTKIKYGPQNIPYFNYLHGTSHSATLTRSQSDGTGGSDVHYQRSGHTYKLRMKGMAWQTYGYTYMKVKQLSSKKVVLTMNGHSWTMTRFYHFPKYHGKAVR